MSGEPLAVIVCHCDFCQKRSGSVFQVSSWFGEDRVEERVGETHVYNGLEVDGRGVDHPGAEDSSISYHFCTTCGSTVFWTIDPLPGMYGVAVGNFVEPSFPAPVVEFHTARRHPWVRPVPGAIEFPGFPDDYSFALTD